MDSPDSGLANHELAKRRKAQTSKDHDVLDDERESYDRKHRAAKSRKRSNSTAERRQGGSQDSREYNVALQEKEEAENAWEKTEDAKDRGKRKGNRSEDSWGDLRCSVKGIHESGKTATKIATRGKQARAGRGGLFCDSEDEDRGIDVGSERIAGREEWIGSSSIIDKEGKRSGGPEKVERGYNWDTQSGGLSGEKWNDSGGSRKSGLDQKPLRRISASLEEDDGEIGSLNNGLVGDAVDNSSRRDYVRADRGESTGPNNSESRKAKSRGKGVNEDDFEPARITDRGATWQDPEDATLAERKGNGRDKYRLGETEKQERISKVDGEQEQEHDRTLGEDAGTGLGSLVIKESDRNAGRQGRSKVEVSIESKPEFWMEGQEASYRGVDSYPRRRESRWDEPDVAKRAWRGKSEDRAGSVEPKGQRLRGRERPEPTKEISDDGSNRIGAGYDGREADRTEDRHKRSKDVGESMREDLESWERSSERRRDYREDEEKGDRHRCSKDKTDIGLDVIEGRGRSNAKIQDEDEELGDRGKPKDGPDFFWEEPEDRRRPGGGGKSGNSGRGVKRSWSPDGRRRGRGEHEEYDREWSDDRRDPERERVYRRDYDRDRDSYRDRERDFQRERDRDSFRDRDMFRGEEFEFCRDRTRDREDTDRWKNRQRDRQKEKDDRIEDVEYNYERDGWEMPRRERDKAERAQRSGEERKEKERVDALKSPQSSGIVSDTMERVGGNILAALDSGRERGLATGSPFLPRRGDTGGPFGDFLGSNSDADWMGIGPDERPRLGEGFSVSGSEFRERYSVEEEGPPGLDQNFGPNSSRVIGEGAMAFNMHGGRGRGPKGSPGHRGRGGTMGGDGRPPFASNQGSGMMMRGMQQGGKGGRGRGGGKGGRGGGRDTQRGGGIPPPLMGPGPGPGPGMAPHFGHMGPPGPMPGLGPNMGPGPAPGMGPGGYPLPPFGVPVGWTGGRGAGDMGMLPGPSGPASVPAPGPAPPRFGPNIGPGPGHNVFFSPPGPGRGTPSGMSGPSYGGASFGGRGMMPEKAPMTRVMPRINAPAGRAPSRGEQNDYSQHFVDTGLRPQNFIRDVDLSDRFEEYPKLKELITRKDKLITERACPPMYVQLDLRSAELTPEFFGTKFDVILVDPPWEEYVRRAPGVGDSMEWWTYEEIQNLRIEAIADTPSFIFLWVGDAEGLDQGRLCLKKWGFRRCEDICWVKTNRENPTPALRHDASTLLQHSKEHCLMGIKGTVRRSNDGHIIHANVDTDIIISEEPPYGSTAKPEEMYHIVEHFAQGQRRLELFGEDHNIRAGWVTVGKGLTSSNFNPQTFIKNFGDTEGKLWQGGRGNPPVDAPHLVGTTPEIEALRPKSPPPRAQQQQSQAANSASQPSAANSNSKKAPTTSQGVAPQNVQATPNLAVAVSGQATPTSSVMDISSPSQVQGPGVGRGGGTGQMPKPRRSPLRSNPKSSGMGPGITADGGLEEEKSVGVDGQEIFPDEEVSRPLKEAASCSGAL